MPRMVGHTPIGEPPHLAFLQKRELEQIVWPTEEEVASNGNMYSLVQIAYDGTYYYRFAALEQTATPHKETVLFARARNYEIKRQEVITGHPLALDAFIRELVDNGYDLARIESVGGCAVNYKPSENGNREATLTIGGSSITFGKPDYNRLKADMLSQNPYPNIGFKESPKH